MAMEVSNTAAASSTMSSAASSAGGAGDEVIIEIVVGLHPQKIFKLLKRMLTCRPSTMLGAMFRQQIFASKTQLSFLDRDSEVFEAVVLPFYLSEDSEFALEPPEGIKPSRYYRELDFWAIEPSLPPCPPFGTPPTEDCSNPDFVARLEIIVLAIKHTEPEYLSLLKAGGIIVRRLFCVVAGANLLVVPSLVRKWLRDRRSLAAAAANNGSALPPLTAKQAFLAAKADLPAHFGAAVEYDISFAEEMLPSAKIMAEKGRQQALLHFIRNGSTEDVNFDDATNTSLAEEAVALLDDFRNAVALLAHCAVARHLVNRRVFREEGLVFDTKLLRFPSKLRSKPGARNAIEALEREWPHPIRNLWNAVSFPAGHSSELFVSGLTGNIGPLTSEEAAIMERSGLELSGVLSHLCIDVRRPE